MRSYAQHGQDTFIFNVFFKDLDRQGTFVDVGAYDGVTFSNTFFFERHLGWSGICIEPLPSVFEVLQANRSSVCLNCAVFDHEGVAEFVDVDMPNFGKMYSGLRASYDPRHADIIRARASAACVIQIPARRLPSILDEYRLSRIDYLSIDTEGSELKILKDLDLGRYDVHLTSVENNYNDTSIQGYLHGHGYRRVNTFAGFDQPYAR